MPSHPHLLFGHHAALAVIANPMRKIKRMLVTKNTQAELGKRLSGIKNLVVVDGKRLESLLPPGAVHQGIAVECAPLSQPSLQEWLQSFPTKADRPRTGTADGEAAGPPLKAGDCPVLLLDQVTDPHNVGAILRSAAAFDIGAVIVTDRHAPTESGIMAKAASGALEIVPLIAVANLVQAIEMLKKAGYWIAGLDGAAKESIHESKLDRKTALVLGAEGAGMRRLTSEHCDFLVKLPISDKMESLNVSNAAAVAIYELYRRHPA